MGIVRLPGQKGYMYLKQGYNLFSLSWLCFSVCVCRPFYICFLLSCELPIFFYPWSNLKKLAILFVLSVTETFRSESHSEQRSQSGSLNVL